MAYHSFIGEVEALNTTTIRRLTSSSRHQLLAIALEALADRLHIAEFDPIVDELYPLWTSFTKCPAPGGPAWT
jgi:hypothetical protein